MRRERRSRFVAESLESSDRNDRKVSVLGAVYGRRRSRDLCFSIRNGKAGRLEGPNELINE